MNKSVFERDVNFDLDRIRQVKIPPRLVPIGAAIIAFIVLAVGSVYQVQPEEVGVVMRFGRFTRTTEPGLQFKVPILESVQKVPVQRQLKEEFGFRTAEADIRTRYTSQRFLDESMMLTGDLNVAMVEWIVQYRVADPYRYLFRVRNVTGTFRHMTQAVMREVVGDRTVTEVLTVGRQEIETSVQEALQELTNQYEMGIAVDQVVLQDVNPPDPVKPSWDGVNQAQQQRDRLINEARAEYNQVIPRARGEAEQTILEAEGYSLDRVNRSRGDASRFRSLHDAYRRSPQVTRQRIYLETMQKVLPRVGGKVFLDKEAKGILPLLHMEKFEDLASPGARREVSR
jgi:modulator of FtsH protease HflK